MREGRIPYPYSSPRLRHSAGRELANDSHSTRLFQFYLGHSNIQNIVTYTELSPARFISIWMDW